MSGLGDDGDGPRVVLVETSAALPGLLPFQAWDALALADVVYLRDPDSHPSAEHLWFAGLRLEQIEPAELDTAGLDLGRPGSPEDRRIAKALLEAAEEQGRVVYLLGPDDAGLTRVVGRDSVDHDAEIEMVFLAQAPRGTELLRVVDVIARLRDPDTGCPWDLEQDHGTLTDSLLEETYELLEAIDRGVDEELQDELGDVLLQVVFHAQIAGDRGAFGIDDVARTVADKLVRRHPHVFADVDVEDVDEVRANWDQIKQEDEERGGPLDSIPSTLPALQLVQKLQRRAARAGLERWSQQPAELAERAAAAVEALARGEPAGEDHEGELGELLQTLVALARSLDLDTERALRRSAKSWRRQLQGTFELAEREEVALEEADEATRQRLWERATGRGGQAGD